MADTQEQEPAAAPGAPTEVSQPATVENGASEAASAAEPVNEQQKEPSDDELKKALHELLATADLATTSEKALRQKLQERFSCDLTSKKALIRAEVEEWLRQQDDAAEEEEEADEEPESDKGKASKGSSKRSAKFGSGLSPEMQAFLGVESMPRTQVVKKIWEYVKANGLQDPRDKRKIVCDDKLKTLFKPPVTMFSLNKQLSKHCFTEGSTSSSRKRKGSDDDDDEEEEESEEEEEEEEEASEGGRGTRRKAAPAPKKKAKSSGGGGKPNGFSKPVKLSEELSEFVGGAEAMSRPELTKLFWDYFKTNNLQDPSDKRHIISDERLEKLLGVKKFQAFGLQKHLSKHFIKE